MIAKAHRPLLRLQGTEAMPAPPAIWVGKAGGEPSAHTQAALFPIWQTSFHVPLAWRVAPDEAYRGRTSSLRKYGQFGKVRTHS